MPLTRRNHWRALASIPVPGPRTPVSVVIPAYRSEATLAHVLAGLAHQTWPAHLLEVVVAADGDEQPVLPDVRPERTRVVPVDAAVGWGPGAARRTGAAAADGEVLLFLDADMLVPHDHVAAHVEWQLRSPEAVTLGHKLFVADWQDVSLDDVIKAAAERRVADLYTGRETHEHWIEEVIAETDDLDASDHMAYRVVVGASLGVHRSLYDEVGGFDPALHRGEDSELGHRLAQAGAVFVPELSSTAWHLGAPTVRTRGDEARRYNRPYLAQRMPQSRWLRATPGRVWDVPFVQAVVDVADADFEVARSCVDRLLMNDEEDLHVSLVGPWGRLHDTRRPVLDDEHRELYMLAEWYRTEPRVHLVEQAPADVFPAPFRLDVDVRTGIRRSTVRRLVAEADGRKVGRVRVLSLHGGTESSVTLTRTAALRRALRQGSDDDTTLAKVWDLRWMDGAGMGLVDLSEPGAAEEVPSWWRAGGRRTEEEDEIPPRRATVVARGVRSLRRVARPARDRSA